MDPAEFSKRMEIARKWAGLDTQPQLVAALKENGETKMGESTIQRIESGKNEPSPAQARAIAEACGVPREFLTDASYDPFSEPVAASDLFSQLDRIEKLVEQIPDGMEILRGLVTPGIRDKALEVVREAQEQARRDGEGHSPQQENQ